MKRTRTTAYRIMAGIALFLAAGQIGAGAQVVVSPPPALINFQGRLAKPDGTPVVDGTNYSVTLSLWDAQSGGAKRWEQTFTNVTVRNGVFAVLLNLGNGFTSGNTLDSTLNNATYLQVQVGTNAPLTPRQQLVSNAYALKAATVADNSISSSKLTADLRSAINGTAGGDLTGSYPNPQIKTDSSLLSKVSGGLFSISTATSTVDQSQPTTTATITSTAWQSFTPSTTGTLVEIDVNTGTAGAAIPVTLNLYAGQGTTGTLVATTPITINPALGLQAFPITANVTAGQTYTWSIGSNNNLIFGYTGGNAYTGGRADLGATFDYQFQTKMKVTTTPANQINAIGNISLTGGKFLLEDATLGPMLVKQYSPFTSGPYNGFGRYGLFIDSGVLFLGVPGTDNAGQSIRLGTWSTSGSRSDAMTILNTGNVGIGTTAPDQILTVAGNARITGSNNGIIFPDGTKQTSAAVVSGTSAGGDLTGTYPNPSLATKASSLAKVSGGPLTSNGSLIGITGSTALEFGQGTSGKQADAGKIGYGTFDPGVLDIVGAGTSGSNRQVKVYAEGGLTVTGPQNLNGALTVSNSGYPTIATTSSSATGTWLQLNNTSTGGQNWNVISSGSGNGEGAGKLLFSNQSNSGTGMNLDKNGNLSVNSAINANSDVTSNNGNVNAPNGSFVGVNSFLSGYVNVSGPSSIFRAPAGNYNGLQVFNNNPGSYPALYVENPGGGYSLYVKGSVHINGDFYANSKSFMIDHPLDPENKYLVHGCIESDEMQNIYNGTVKLDDKGEATVQMPNWFQALNKDCRYQLTCIGGYAQVYIAEEMTDNHFKISGGKPGLKVSWMVSGVRQDAWAKANPMQVEKDKGANRGKYMSPEAFGLPASRGESGQLSRPAPKPADTKLTASPAMVSPAPQLGAEKVADKPRADAGK